MAYARPWFRDAKNTRSKVPLFPATFAPWAPRALAADAAGRHGALQPDFNVSVFECFDTSSSAGLRELDESDRSVQKSAESTLI